MSFSWQFFPRHHKMLKIKLIPILGVKGGMRISISCSLLRLLQNGILVKVNLKLRHLFLAMLDWLWDLMLFFADLAVLILVVFF